MNAETMTDKPAPVEVTQADREAAASYFDQQSKFHHADFIRYGDMDGSFLVQAFARHRLTAWNARTVQAELVEALRSNVATMEEQRRRFTALGRSCAELTTAINETRTAITRATGAAS